VGSRQNIDSFFRPQAIAVIGATNLPRRLGQIFIRNLLAGGFDGPIMPVNPDYRSIGGVLAYPNIASLPVVPDLAVICTPAATIPAIIDSLGRAGTRAAIVASGEPGQAGRLPSADALLAAARPYGLRILGTNSLGVVVPGINLNATFAHTTARPGRVAFISQSGALGTAVLDWAAARGIGFSHFVSLGNASDVDFGDVMDYLGRDDATRAILLYIEDMRERRNFMAAGRAAARNKPVLVVKANRIHEGDDVAAAALASGALAGADDVFDAALRRAGMLRVDDVDELFAAFETLARTRSIAGDRLMVLTNGGGAASMVSDALFAGGGHLAAASASSVGKLRARLPDGAVDGNPVEMDIDASGEHYAAALEILLDDPQADAVLVTYAPNALVPPEEPAAAVIRTAKEFGGNILTSWIGEASVGEARRMFAAAGIPTFATPNRAVSAFLHMVNYHRNQQMLMQVPPSSFDDFRPDQIRARSVIGAALAEGRTSLTEPEAKTILSAYGLTTVETRIAASAEDAAAIAAAIGFPIALTILAPTITRKWDVGGVALNLQSPEAVASAAAGMVERLRERKPGAAHTGFTVQRMVSRQAARQLIIGVATDRLFGPVILFGEGGRAVEIIRDHAVALPPLNVVLARELISRTRISRLMEAYLDRPAVNLDSLCTALMRVSQMVVDIPEIREVDINPVFADDKGVTVVDAHMTVARFAGNEATRLAIRPYPKALEETARLADGRMVSLRPIRPEDAAAHYALMESMSPEDLRLRFFNAVGKLQPSQIARLTQIDYEREMAFIATVAGDDGKTETLGVVRTVADADDAEAEFSIKLLPRMKGSGLARLLMEKMIRYCRGRGMQTIRGDVLVGNVAMTRLAEKLGFCCRDRPGGELVEVRLDLRPPS
jgi:acetyltransferase